jgi:uncharacterized protein
MKFWLLSIILLVCSHNNLYSEQNFAPKNCDVYVADETISEPIFTKTDNQHVKKKTITNGAQAGAFFFILFFQRVISPQDGPSCKYYPTCSHYGKKAVQIHGGLLGGFLAGDRILRCNPFTTASVDYVPIKIFSK